MTGRNRFGMCVKRLQIELIRPRIAVYTRFIISFGSQYKFMVCIFFSSPLGGGVSFWPTTEVWSEITPTMPRSPLRFDLLCYCRSASPPRKFDSSFAQKCTPDSTPRWAPSALRSFTFSPSAARQKKSKSAVITVRPRRAHTIGGTAFVVLKFVVCTVSKKMPRGTHLSYYTHYVIILYSRVYYIYISYYYTYCADFARCLYIYNIIKCNTAFAWEYMSTF